MKIDLIVRGVCCLRPGVAGVSENIRVVSIVGRFLEHSRIYYFRNGGKEEIYVGSADLMRRNLDRRVEVLFPLEDPALKRHVRDDVLEIYLRDTANAHQLLPDGRYVRVPPAPGEEPFDVQDWFLAQHTAGASLGVEKRLLSSAPQPPGRKPGGRRNGHARPPAPGHSPPRRKTHEAGEINVGEMTGRME